MRITPAGPDALGLLPADPSGAPVAVVGALALRTVTGDRFAAAPGQRAVERARHARRTDLAGDTTGAAALAGRLAGRSEAAADRILLDLVRTQVTAVLGHHEPRATAGHLAVKNLVL
ncbi:hypothetical protein VM98_35095, partial [Streptomyces rubellomurinus subsp. indigoferus]